MSEKCDRMKMSEITDVMAGKTGPRRVSGPEERPKANRKKFPYRLTKFRDRLLG